MQSSTSCAPAAVTQVLLRPADELGSVKEVVGRAAEAFVKDFRAANSGQQ